MRKVSLEEDDKLKKLKFESHTLPCLRSVGFCKTTLKLPSTSVWFSGNYCLIVHISDFIGACPNWLTVPG